MSNPEKYYRLYPLNTPAHSVIKIAGKAIRDRASTYFSGRMLEVGCGTKIKRFLVGDLVDEHIGLDHEDCPHDHSNIDIFGTAYEMPVEDGSFDCILSTAVMEHLEEPQKAAEEAFRVLKSNGYGLYTVPLYWHLHEEPRDFFRYTKYGIEYIFRKAGFEIVEVTPLSGFITTFITEFNYYLMRRSRAFRLEWLASGIVAFNNILFPRLDRGFLRDEKFTWMYVVVVQKLSGS